jgi:hypothetical protein
MPSRLIQLNGMNFNAGGLIEFRATMQPASQVSCDVSQIRDCDQHQDCGGRSALCASVKMILCNFDHKEVPEVGWGDFQLIATRDPAVLVIRCDWRNNSVLFVHNLDETARCGAMSQ